MTLPSDSMIIVKITIQGLLPGHWSAWFDGLTIQPTLEGQTCLQGQLSDQAALLGVLNKIHGLNLKIVTLQTTCKDN